VAQLIQELTVLPTALVRGSRIARVTVVYGRIGEPAFGTTPGDAEVMATLRSDREEVLERLRTEAVKRLERISHANALEHSHSWTDDFPVTVNDSDAVGVVEAVAEARGIAVSRRNAAYPWSEDFGWFTRRYPGAIFGLGSGVEHPALHSPDYDFPDELIPVGLGVFESIIERLLG